MSKLKVKILDTAAGFALFKELGLMEAANAALAGDYMTAWNIFMNNMVSIFDNQGVGRVLSIIFKYSMVKMVTGALPGTGKTFSVLGLIDIEV